MRINQQQLDAVAITMAENGSAVDVRVNSTGEWIEARPLGIHHTDAAIDAAARTMDTLGLDIIVVDPAIYDATADRCEEHQPSGRRRRPSQAALATAMALDAGRSK